jgi:3'-phosphoadenosine 5'-phosphosulfate sulfotransferase (PAPS reductase)/FAD synthetase
MSVQEELSMNQIVNATVGKRVICNFSAGAASAVATKLALATYPEAEIVCVVIKEEHSDNERFRKDCEKWFGRTVTIIKDEKYGASVREVWRRLNFMKSKSGAPCTKWIKRHPLRKYFKADDIQIIGFTCEEQDRREKWIKNNPNHQIIIPLIDAGLSKSDCLAMIERAGIELPTMYKLGFNNNNCIGCVKGGMGYWNHIRKHFPDDFAEVAQIQKEIGDAANLWKYKGRRISLLELPLDAGRHDEQIPDCTMFCEIAEGSYAA